MRVVLSVVFSALILVGCNTVEGVGKDIQKGGQAIERAADKGK
jgi:predicted small secreted protein